MYERLLFHVLYKSVGKIYYAMVPNQVPVSSVKSVQAV